MSFSASQCAGGEHFVTDIPSLAISAFGVSPVASRKRAELMFHTLFDAIRERGGLDAALGRLNDAGVTWKSVSEGSWSLPLRMQREGGVSAGTRG